MDTQHLQSLLRTIALGLLLGALAAACSSADQAENAAPEPTAEPAVDPTATVVPTATPAPTPTPEPTPTPPATPSPTSEPAADTLDWLVSLLNNEDPELDEDAVAAKFSPEFLAVVPIAQITGSLPQFWGAEWTIVSSDIDGRRATSVLAADGEPRLNATLAVQIEPPHLIDELLFTPTTAAIAPISNLGEYEEALAVAAPIHQAAIFEIIDGACVAAADLGADTVMPIGSVFKLWVLAELAHQVESGEASWDEILPVSATAKSSPGGTVFAMPEGTEVTLRTYAEEMISISDNSATDHLMYRLGRERVEAAMVASGVSETDRNIPMMTTADLFRIKFDPEPPNSAEYRALDAAGRRSLLDTMEDETWIEDAAAVPLTNADGVPINDPRDHDLEWFATPRDLCATHAYLAELALRPGLEPVADILRLNATSGAEFDETIWTDVRFKGGSEQGIVAGAWWMQRADGRTFVVAGGMENPETALNTIQAGATLQQGATLAAQVD